MNQTVHSGVLHRHQQPAFLSSPRRQSNLTPAQPRQRTLTVQNALNRKGKEAAVEKLTAAFEESTAVFGIRFQNISVKKLQQLRRSLPQEGAHMYVVKNNLLKIAADKVDGWSELKQSAKGDNAWIFAREENVSACVKAFMEFEKDLKADIPKDKRAAAKPTDITGGVLDGYFLDYANVLKLEKMPSKQELIRDVAIMIKKVPTKVALSIKAVPTKLARAINLLAQGDENGDLLVGEVFPKARAASEVTPEAAPEA